MDARREATEVWMEGYEDWALCFGEGVVDEVGEGGDRGVRGLAVWGPSEGVPSGGRGRAGGGGGCSMLR